MSQEPTPTDPREEKPEIVHGFTLPSGHTTAYLDHWKEFAKFYSEKIGGTADPRDSFAKMLLEFYVEGGFQEFQRNQSTNSKLAAEIAELKAEYKQEREGMLQGITTLRAELEAARKELGVSQTEALFYREKFEEYAAACEWMHHDETLRHPTDSNNVFISGIATLRKQRDTALAAKDAAEKARDQIAAEMSAIKQYYPEIYNASKIVRSVLSVAPSGECPDCHGGGKVSYHPGIDEDCRRCANQAALTPAPTQDPPAGVSPWQPIETAPTDGKIQIMIAEFRDGELIDIDFDAVLEQESESWEMPQTYWVWKSAHGRVENPTHWQPIIPPACGVTISNDSSLPKAGNNAETKEGIVPSPSDGKCDSAAIVLLPRDDREQVGQATPDVRPVPAVTPSPSPANIPPEGRGECVHGIKMTQVCEKCSRFLHFHHGGRGELLPFNLSDALAGKPVVTRHGRRATNFRPNQEPETMKWCQWAADVEGMKFPITYSDAGQWDGKDGNKSPLDLFMLPTEGSGA